MANEEISVESMRFLFSLLDIDGGSSLSSEEIKRGMLLLGFEEAHDPVALGRLIQSIDGDQTGTISESEFLAFMSKESRRSLKDKMAKWSLQYTHMQATRYSTTGELNLEMTELPSTVCEGLICEALKSDTGYNYWIEVVGYDRATFTALANALGVSHDDLADALLFSAPVCRSVEGAAAPVALIILHHARMSVDPVLPRSRSLVPAPLVTLIDALIGGDSVNIKPPELLRGCRLAHKDVICDAAVTLEQAAILVVSDRLVLTLRLPSFQSAAPPPSATKVAGASTPREVRWAPLSAAARPGGARPFASDDSSVRVAFDKLRRRLPALALDTLAAAGGRGRRSSAAEAPAPQRNGGAKLLAVLLTDCLVSSLRALRNCMQDWDELLDASIRGRQCSANTIHLEAMDAVAGNFKAILDPLALALDPANWVAPADEGAGDAVMQLVAGITPRTARGGGAAAIPLQQFFLAELKYFKEIAEDVGVRSDKGCGGVRSVGSSSDRTVRALRHARIAEAERRVWWKDG
jgi:Ca2+-binding EF-hand superfamily protein